MTRMLLAATLTEQECDDLIALFGPLPTGEPLDEPDSGPSDWPPQDPAELDALDRWVEEEQQKWLAGHNGELPW